MPSQRWRRSCSAVLSRRSAPLTTLFTPTARSSTTTASGYDAKPSRRRTMKSPTVRFDTSTQPCTRSMNSGVANPARTRRALPSWGNSLSRHVPGYWSCPRSSRRVQPQAKHLAPSCATAPSWRSWLSLCRCTGPSQRRPCDSSVARMAASASGSTRGVSRSSIRTSQVPRRARASSQEATAVSSDPICRGPDGVGANRPT